MVIKMCLFSRHKDPSPEPKQRSDPDYSLLTFGNDHVTRSQLTPAYIREVRAKALADARELLKRDLPY